MTTTPKLGATDLVASQAIPETAVNENARLWDQGALHFAVKDKDLATPPGSPADGDAYIVAASPTGDWSGKAGNIAFYQTGTGWRFVAPFEGLRADVADEDIAYRYDGSAWATTAASRSRVVNIAILNTALAASEPFAALVAPSGETWTFAGNFSGAYGKKLSGGTNPASSFAIDVVKNGSSVGTITISTSGVVSFATSGGTSFTISGTDGLQFVGPASADTAVGYAIAIPVSY